MGSGFAETQFHCLTRWMGVQ
ncbi:hypothetical protein GBAR_LOCUS31461 [Geodia barretti]|uniref:Uncharacterized protein n=1 Tax=Geodia barretti TaxID=519541 RepID=A0AA35XMC4_GEOBA|nr:hypothetical protein GBAR_LOCUS31461 [Geodia barretti]